MFNVVWEPDALQALASIWMASADRPAVNSASEMIERHLESDPLRYGIPVVEGLFAIDEPPLRALFEIDDVASRITIVSLSLKNGDQINT